MEDSGKYDFLITDDGEVMLIMETKDGTVKNPRAVLYPMLNKIILKRNPKDECTFNGVRNSVFDNLKDEKELLVCEIKPTSSTDELEIVRSYYIEITEENEK